MNTGGARKGAGRKPTGSTKTIMNFGFDRDVVELLKTKIQAYKRTKFVQAAIKEKLEKI